MLLLISCLRNYFITSLCDFLDFWAFSEISTANFQKEKRGDLKGMSVILIHMITNNQRMIKTNAELHLIPPHT